MSLTIQMVFCSLLPWTLILGACSTSLPPTDAPALATATLPPSVATGQTAILAPTFEGCGYMWAYQDLPDLSIEFQHEVQRFQVEAQANAYAFGEDCIYADGHKTFSAKETDFNVTMQVDDLSNEASLGEWIVKIMQVVVNIPKEKIVGPQSGVVFINFQSGSDQKNVNFYIDQYQALPPGLSTAEIYQALLIPQ